MHLYQASPRGLEPRCGPDTQRQKSAFPRLAGTASCLVCVCVRFFFFFVDLITQIHKVISIKGSHTGSTSSNVM
jgi:hypothetical protein